MSGLILLKIR